MHGGYPAQFHGMLSPLDNVRDSNSVLYPSSTRALIDAARTLFFFRDSTGVPFSFKHLQKRTPPPCTLPPVLLWSPSTQKVLLRGRVECLPPKSPVTLLDYASLQPGMAVIFNFFPPFVPHNSLFPFTTLPPQSQCALVALTF